MTRKTFFAFFIVGLSTFLIGWFLNGNLHSSSQAKETESNNSFIDTIDVDSMKSNDFSYKISGHFIMTESNCAGFDFIDKDTVLWTNEIACDDPDTLRLRWLSDSTFMTRSTLRVNEICAPKVDIYKVVSFENKHLILKSIWTGWSNSKDENIEFTKRTN